MKPLYIFDLDGTLADIEHRRHIIEDPSRDDSKWRRFYAACVDDVPNAPVISVMEALRRFADVWIFSGRSSEVRPQTVAWLAEHTSLNPLDMECAVRMRDEGDYTPDHVLKKQWLDSMLIDDRQRLVAVFDDRSSVVKMWRDAGVACFQVAPGEF